MTRTAVLIQAHNNFKYISLLAEKNGEINFYLHIDKKVKISEDIYSLLSKPNIKVVENPVSVYWGGFSQIEATLKLFDLAIKDKGNDFFHLMSGECFPLIDFEEIEERWGNKKNSVFIEMYERPETYWRLNIGVPYSNSKFIRTIMGRICNRGFKILGKYIKTTRLDVKYYCFGSQWFSIKRENVESILEKERKGFFKQFRYTSCIDEHAFQIALKIDGVKGDGNNRYIRFKKGKSSPDYMDDEDISVAKKSGYWFIRKVNEKDAIRLLNGN
ncbi:beta-1,6-N-acetylglucosaminyltransferase [Tatumella ptyseos]|uniref:beta-1,6-N-acetylglucosaminyltransferase n=1 Tax=Tatumella ptyseos TaxID=82987 RepID=UPI0023F391C5|nr:beta-1,6-N-acetylglucosaminyltransferase [Tatumella ptyseos]